MDGGRTTDEDSFDLDLSSPKFGERRVLISYFF